MITNAATKELCVLCFIYIHFGLWFTGVNIPTNLCSPASLFTQEKKNVPPHTICLSQVMIPLPHPSILIPLSPLPPVLRPSLCPSLTQMQRAVNNRMRADLIQKASL